MIDSLVAEFRRLPGYLMVQRLETDERVLALTKEQYEEFIFKLLGRASDDVSK